MAQAPPAASAIEGMEAPPHAEAQPACARYLRNERPSMGELAEGILAHRWIQTSRRRPVQRLLDRPWPPGIPWSLPPFPGMLSEPPDADPHVRWCGGRQGEPGAYPISSESKAGWISVPAVALLLNAEAVS